MTKNGKKALFDRYRRSLAAAGLVTAHDDSLICPLCWQETTYAGLSCEDFVPRSVGGRRKTLTCRKCNNKQGSFIDEHLSQFQRSRDAFQGHGTFRAKLIVSGNEVTANLKWGKRRKDFSVVGKASNPAVSNEIEEYFKTGKVPQLNFTILFGYAKNNFQTAVLRAAYLVLFKCFGYEYANHEIVQTIRRRICDPSIEHPRLGSLIIELRNCRLPYDKQHVVAPGKVNGVGFFLVIIRVRKATTTYLGAFLPAPGERSDEFFDLMEQWSRKHDAGTFTIPTKGLVT